MAENSAIEWTTHTFNPWRGCTKVSPGCAHCYAETLSGRNPGTLGVWGPSGTRVVAAESQWKLPLKWNREAAAWPGRCSGCPAAFQSVTSGTCGICGAKIVSNRPRVFCASLADVFEDWQGAMIDSQGRTLVVDESGRFGVGAGPGSRHATMQDVRRRLFDLIDATPNLDWLVLTKRPENIEWMMPDYKDCNCFVPQMEGAGQHSPTCAVFRHRPNVWLGTSVENQATADARIPHLLRAPAAVRFLSCEPLLGAVDLSAWLLLGIDWVIVGGESGPGARPCRVEWVRSIVEQCKDAGVPCFVKQLGSNPVGDDFPEERDPVSGNRIIKVRQVLTIRDKKGGDMSEWPAALRVREFPKAVP